MPQGVSGPEAREGGSPLCEASGVRSGITGFGIGDWDAKVGMHGGARHEMMQEGPQRMKEMHETDFFAQSKG